MKTAAGICLVIIAVAASASAQARPKTPVSAKPMPAKPAASKPATTQLPPGVPAVAGKSTPAAVSDRTYANKEFGFEVTFPATWLIPGDGFESEMKKAGFDLSLSTPTNVTGVDRARMNKALQQVKVLFTAYRSMPGSADNAIVRISLEDLRANPQIKDAVDYLDAMRAQFRSMKLPADFKYFETQAEQLGKQQFGFLDSSTGSGKKRLYATVRGGYAVLFSISYSKDEDLQVFRKVLSDGNFALK